MKCSMKCSTDANDEHTMKVININLMQMMEETVNSSRRRAIVVVMC